MLGCSELFEEGRPFALGGKEVKFTKREAEDLKIITELGKNREKFPILRLERNDGQFHYAFMLEELMKRHKPPGSALKKEQA
jgi:hypothetical protein